MENGISLLPTRIILRGILTVKAVMVREQLEYAMKSPGLLKGLDFLNICHEITYSVAIKPVFESLYVFFSVDFANLENY